MQRYNPNKKNFNNRYILNYIIYKTLQGHGLLEMPSGTGKTISLLSLIVAYMIQNPHHVR